MLTKLIAPLGALVAASFPLLATAAAPAQVHGFLAQGYSLSDGNNVNGESRNNGGSFMFREAGLNTSWRPVARVLLSAQLASVRQGKVTDENFVLDYALLDAIAYQSQSSQFGLRVGKLKLPFGLYNESRDAVHSRPSILLPQSLYLDTDGARAFGYFSAPGWALYGNVYLGSHIISTELQALTHFRLEDSAEISILRRPASGRFETDKGIVGRIIDEWDGGRWRFSITAAQARLSYRNGDQPPFDQDGKFRFRQYFASLQHNRERLSLTTEIVRRRIQLDDLIGSPAATSTTDQDSVGFYVQGTYRLNERWSLLARYDERQRELQDRSGHAQAARSGLPRHYFFARDLTLGTRFDLSPRLGLWSELHLIDGTLWVNPLDNPSLANGGAERYWSLLMLMAAYRF